MRYISIGLLLISAVFSKSKTEKIIEDFLIARYSGDTTKVQEMVSENFLYKNVPYSGLNFTAEYNDGNLVVTDYINEPDSLTIPFIGIGDTIHEIDNKRIDDYELPITGPINSNIKMVITKSGDTTFTTEIAKLTQIQVEEDISSFLSNISEYNKHWYEFDLNVIQILSKKNTSMVYYRWNGIKIKNGPIYEFYRMEYIKTDRKTGLITSLEGLWSQAQFLDQFK